MWSTSANIASVPDDTPELVHSLFSSATTHLHSVSGWYDTRRYRRAERDVTIPGMRYPVRLRAQRSYCLPHLFVRRGFVAVENASSGGETGAVTDS
jgi:hypothetical protein